MDRWVNRGLALYSSLRRGEGAPNRPLHLQIEPTSRCNLACSFCSRTNSVTIGSDMDLDQYLVLLREVQPERVTWAGRGEPFMAKRIFDMIRAAKRVGAMTTVTTNFTMGPAIASKVIDAGLDFLRVSIDASSPERYLQVRGANFYDRILLGLERVRDEKARRGSKTPAVGFEYVLMKDNVDDAMGVLKMAPDYGVERVHFRLPGLVGIEDRTETIIGGLSVDGYAQLLSRLKDVVPPSLQTNLELLEAHLQRHWKGYAYSGVEAAGEVQETESTCVMPWLQLYVSAEGETSPCCALHMDEQYNFGNIFEGGFQATWHGPEWREMRKRMAGGPKPFESCYQCMSNSLTYLTKKSRVLFGRTR